MMEHLGETAFFLWLTWVRSDDRKLQVSPFIDGRMVCHFGGLESSFKSKKDFLDTTMEFLDDPLVSLSVGIGVKQQSRYYSTCFS